MPSSAPFPDTRATWGVGSWAGAGCIPRQAGPDQGQVYPLTGQGQVYPLTGRGQVYPLTGWARLGQV